MAKITITEALAEIKTINARIDKRREAVMRYFTRDARLRDPLEADGGSVQFVQRERQAIHDLEERTVLIRSAIQQANMETKLAVRGQERTVSEWLNWRRDVSAKSKGFLGTMAQAISAARSQASKNGMRLAEADPNAKPGEVVVAVGEKALSDEIEAMEALLGELDGKLSLVNATVLIDV